METTNTTKSPALMTMDEFLEYLRRADHGIRPRPVLARESLDIHRPWQHLKSLMKYSIAAAWCSIGCTRNERTEGCAISRGWHAHG